MELKPGYKRTEVGVIPEDWEAESLGYISEVVMGQSPVGTSYNQDGYGIPLINGPTEFTEKYPIKKQWTTEPTKICKAGDLLLCVRGSSTGRMNISNDEYCIGRGIAAIRAKRGADTKFITFQIDSAIQKLLALSAGSTFPNVDGKSIRSITIPLPPLPEQRAIAAALSDVDALISALDKLIAKKRDIKQATMQQLLTGKTRLPGFEGEWEMKRLGEMAFVATGNTPPTSDPSNYGDDQLFVSPADLGKRKYILDTEKKLSKKGFSISRKFPKGSILFTCIGSTIGKAGIALDELTSNQQINAIFPDEKFSNDFLYYSLDFHSPKIRALASEQAVPIINKTEFEKIIIRLPPLPEQQALAAILSDMDAEIVALEERREKSRVMYQGMMQELLTGKTRLV